MPSNFDAVHPRGISLGYPHMSERLFSLSTPTARGSRNRPLVFDAPVSRPAGRRRRGSIRRFSPGGWLRRWTPAEMVFFGLTVGTAAAMWFSRG